jgi:hypothetical protein
MVINENETITRPANHEKMCLALAEFVQSRGKQIHAAFLMSKLIRWTDDEFQRVAQETKDRFPNERHLVARNFIEAQQILPEDRRRDGKLSYSSIKKLQDLTNGAPYRNPKSNGTTAPRVRTLAKPAPAAAPESSAADFAQALANQITAAVLQMSATALELAAAELRQKSVSSV